MSTPSFAVRSSSGFTHPVTGSLGPRHIKPSQVFPDIPIPQQPANFPQKALPGPFCDILTQEHRQQLEKGRSGQAIERAQRPPRSLTYKRKGPARKTPGDGSQPPVSQPPVYNSPAGLVPPSCNQGKAEPAYPTPAYTTQASCTPASTAPAYNMPAYTTPASIMPAFTTPDYTTTASTMPEYTTPASTVPAYTTPVYNILGTTTPALADTINLPTELKGSLSHLESDSGGESAGHAGDSDSDVSGAYGSGASDEDDSEDEDDDGDNSDNDSSDDESCGDSVGGAGELTPVGSRQGPYPIDALTTPSSVTTPLPTTPARFVFTGIRTPSPSPGIRGSDSRGGRGGHTRGRVRRGRGRPRGD